MKVYISADLEGATGVVHVDQTNHEKPVEYAFGCRMQLHDVNAVIEGLTEAGVEDVLVNDAHDRMINLDVSALNQGVRLLSGSPKVLGMMEGCGEADAVIFVAYHAMAGTPNAVLDHTISGRRVYSVQLNGREVGETGLNAAVAAHYGIPVAMLTGDRAACSEASALLGDGLVTACVKEAHGRFSAECLTPDESAKLLRAAAVEAVARVRAGTAPRMDVGDGSFDLRITFHTTLQCDRGAILPGVERLGGRTLRVCGYGMAEMRRWSGALIGLGSD